MHVNCRQKPEDKVLIGFSGGPDSLCLLHGLVQLGWPVIAAHYDHTMRPESRDEADKVAGMAAKMGVKLVLGRGDVPGFARENGLSQEEAARTLRYRFLFDHAHRNGAAAVLVGHNADDQVETVLMHLLRGAGISGLKGMAAWSVLPEWDAEIPLVRPLLGIWRADIEKYCQEEGLQPLRDPTNQEVAFFRNRLRHELIPYLEEYNPGVRSVLWRTAQALSGDYEVLQTLVDAAWSECLEMRGEGFLTLRVSSLRAQGEGMQRSLLRKAISVLRPALRDIGFDTLQRAQAFLLKPSRSQAIDLINGLTLLMEQGRLYLYENKARLPYPWPRVGPDFSADLEVPGRLILPDGSILTADWGKVEKIEENPWQASLDYDLLHQPLTVRAASLGERWQPLGMLEGSIKLSDFWINAGLPRRARKDWPLVYSGKMVAWVPGFRPAHAYRMHEKTQRVVVLQLTPPAGQEFQLN